MKVNGLPDDNVPVFGFRTLHFTPKRSCEVCGRRVYVGLVSIHNDDASRADFKVVCRRCGDRWDDEAKELGDNAQS